MDRSMVTTAFTIDGYRIVKNLGLVRGITVRSRSIFGTVGGASKLYLAEIFLYSQNYVKRPAKNHLKLCFSMAAL